MRVGDLAAAPGAQIFPLAVKDHHRGILALEYVNPVLPVGRHPADQPEGLSRWKLKEIADQLVAVFARSKLCHRCLPPGKISTTVRSPAYSGHDLLFRRLGQRKWRPSSAGVTPDRL